MKQFQIENRHSEERFEIADTKQIPCSQVKMVSEKFEY